VRALPKSMPGSSALSPAARSSTFSRVREVVRRKAIATLPGNECDC
jgi:hypothetical protein